MGAWSKVSSTDLISGIETISMSPAPARFRSTRVSLPDNVRVDLAVSYNSATLSVRTARLYGVGSSMYLLKLDLFYPYDSALGSHLKATILRERGFEQRPFQRQTYKLGYMRHTVFLGYLISTWEVSVEVMFSIEQGCGMDVSIESERGSDT